MHILDFFVRLKFFDKKLPKFKEFFKRKENSSGGWSTVSDDTLDK